jgi:hypothetical protein
MSETTQTLQEAKEAYLNEMETRVTSSLSATNLSTRFETSSCAPAFGWSEQEYLYMPLVAQRLRAKGFSVTSSVNHGVTDWIIGV